MRKRALDQITRVLCHEYITLEDDRLTVKEPVVEGLIDTDSAVRELKSFLLQHRRLFRNRITRRLFSQAENHAWALFELAISGKLDSEAMLDLYSAASGFYAFFGYFNNRGNLYNALGQYERAEEDYKRAIEMNPNYAAAYSNLGNLLSEQAGREGEAEEAYRKAIELNPDYAAAYSNLGILLKNQGREGEAEEAYRKAIEKDPNLVQAYYNMACLYALMGNADQSCSWLRQAINLDSKYIELARADSDFDPIRNYPCFKELIPD